MIVFGRIPPFSRVGAFQTRYSLGATHQPSAVFQTPYACYDCLT